MIAIDRASVCLQSGHVVSHHMGKDHEKQIESRNNKWFARVGRVLGRILSRRENKDDENKAESPKEEHAPDHSSQTGARYKPESLDVLCQKTKFSRKELKIMYRGFKNECPTGIVDEATFKEIYAHFFPQGDCGRYAHHVFNAFDRDHSGTMTFDEFVIGLSLLVRGSMQEKLQWTFSLYDVNGDGRVSRDDLHDVIMSIYDLMGKHTEPSIDESTILDHVDHVFMMMDANHNGFITVDEFVAACKKDNDMQQSMAAFDTVF